MKQNSLIDFHTHILPAVDDGSKDVALSVQMLDSLSEQSVGHVVLTPHYYSQREPLEHFTARRQTAVDLLQQEYSGPLTLHLGAEVYFSEYLFNNRDLSSLCIDNTNTMLLELPYNKTIDDKILDQIWRLIAEYNIDLVIAHIERYPSVFKSHQVLDKLISMGCTLQVNLSSLERFGKRRLIRLFQEGYIGAVGTDAHNMSERNPGYSQGYQVLSKALSDAQLDSVLRNMLSLLNI